MVRTWSPLISTWHTQRILRLGAPHWVNVLADFAKGLTGRDGCHREKVNMRRHECDFSLSLSCSFLCEANLRTWMHTRMHTYVHACPLCISLDFYAMMTLDPPPANCSSTPGIFQGLGTLAVGWERPGDQRWCFCDDHLPCGSACTKLPRMSKVEDDLFPVASQVDIVKIFAASRWGTVNLI